MNEKPHARGIIPAVAPGICEGLVAFPARGNIRVYVERRGDDVRMRTAADSAWSLLTVGDERWSGTAPVDGYRFDVIVRRGHGGLVVEFWG
jgi:hypothetical protein